MSSISVLTKNFKLLNIYTKNTLMRRYITLARRRQYVLMSKTEFLILTR